MEQGTVVITVPCKMFDTVRITILEKHLKLERGNLHLKSYAEYRPSEHTDSNNGIKIRSIVKIPRPTKLEQKLGIYIVRLDETKPQGQLDRINIELSVPKFLLGSNTYEIANDDLEIFIDRLRQLLQGKVKETLTNDDICYAIVRRIDFCKNIKFETPKHNVNWFLKILSTYAFDPRYKLTQRTYENNSRDGSSASFHNTRQAIKFYNKTEQILNSQHLTIDEKVLSNKLKGLPFEILRIEISLQHFQSVNSILSKYLEKKRFYTLKDLWNEDLSKSIITDYVEQLTNYNLNFFNHFQYPEDTTMAISLLQNMNFKESSEIFFISKLNAELGTQGVKATLGRYLNKSQLINLIKKLNANKKYLSDLPKSSMGTMWDIVFEQLKIFKILKPPTHLSNKSLYRDDNI